MYVCMCVYKYIHTHTYIHVMILQTCLQSWIDRRKFRQTFYQSWKRVCGHDSFLSATFLLSVVLLTCNFNLPHTATHLPRTETRIATYRNTRCNTCDFSQSSLSHVTFILVLSVHTKCAHTHIFGCTRTCKHVIQPLSHTLTHSPICTLTLKHSDSLTHTLLEDCKQFVRRVYVLCEITTIISIFTIKQCYVLQLC